MDFNLQSNLISKQADIIKTKIFIFSTGFGGVWIFTVANIANFDYFVAISIAGLVAFGAGVATNLTKLTKLSKELETLKDKNGNNS